MSVPQMKRYLISVRTQHWAVVEAPDEDTIEGAVHFGGLVDLLQSEAKIERYDAYERDDLPPRWTIVLDDNGDALGFRKKEN